MVDKNKNKRGPKIKEQPKARLPKQGVDIENYKQLPVCWQIGNIDWASPWGKETILGKVKFNFSNSLFEKIASCEDKNIDCEALNKALEELEGKTFNNAHDFIKSLNKKFSGPIPSSILHELFYELSHKYFFDTLYPLIQDRENATWHELDTATRSNGKSNSHNILVTDLCKEARDRLDELKYEISELYSLRLGGTLRIFGIRIYNYLKVIWFDTGHEICS